MWYRALKDCPTDSGSGLEVNGAPSRVAAPVPALRSHTTGRREPQPAQRPRRMHSPYWINEWLIIAVHRLLAKSRVEGIFTSRSTVSHRSAT